MERKKCSCGDDAYKLVYRTTAESTRDTVVAFCCNPCVNRVLERIRTSLTFWAPSDCAWSEDLPATELYETEENL